jgi:predicted MFS family arabinose efflux permease
MMLAIGTFAIGTDAFVIGGVLPAVARSLGVSASSAGLLVTAFAVAYAPGAPILAVASARLARRALLVSALTVFAAANALAAVAPTYALVLIARVLAALAAAAFVPASSAVATSLAPTESRGRALATVVAGLTVAQVMGVPFGAFAGASLGWRLSVAAAVHLAVASADHPSGGGRVYRLDLHRPLLSQAGHYHGAMISMALLVFGVASVAGSTLGGRLTDRFGALPWVSAVSRRSPWRCWRSAPPSQRRPPIA